MTFQFDLDHRVLIEARDSWGRAEGSRGLLICLLAGELTCHGRVLQLHARQRVLYVRQVVSQRGLELQSSRGRGVRARLRTHGRLVLVSHAPLFQHMGLVLLHAAAHDLSLDQAVENQADHHHGDRPRGEDDRHVYTVSHLEVQSADWWL